MSREYQSAVRAVVPMPLVRRREPFDDAKYLYE
jgi:hypothetical protein